MHVGLSIAFQNPQYQNKSDLEAYQDDLRLADRCEELGFGSIWTTEHHFNDYMMIPDPLQFLCYMAGRTKHALLGTMVVVLPWHDPVWVAEKVSQLDNLSNGRVVLGIGRGAARLEFEGFGVEMSESRDRFIEATHLITRALATGYLEGDGPYYPHPRRQLRPAPVLPFADRTYAAAASPESYALMAELGLGLMYLSQMPPSMVADNFATYRQVFREKNGAEAPPPIFSGFVFCDKDAGRAHELGNKWGAKYWAGVLAHYEMLGTHFEGTKGYEYYAQMSAAGRAIGEAEMVNGIAEMQIVGTPDQCFDRIMEVREVIKSESFLGIFKYVDMPFSAANSSMELFAREVMPRLKAVQPRRAPETASQLAVAT